MEQEKQEKKENILKITKQVEEVAKDSYKELEAQGTQLKTAQQDMKKINDDVDQIDHNLTHIENRKKSSFKNCVGLLSCCQCCTSGSYQRSIELKEQLMQKQAAHTKSLKISIYEEHLSPERIDKEWCMRYDPEDRWIKQVEIGLDFLLRLAEQMKISFDEQNKLAEQIYLDVKSTKSRMSTSRRKMQDIQNQPKPS